MLRRGKPPARGCVNGERTVGSTLQYNAGDWWMRQRTANIEPLFVLSALVNGRWARRMRTHDATLVYSYFGRPETHEPRAICYARIFCNRWRNALRSIDYDALPVLTQDDA